MYFRWTLFNICTLIVIALTVWMIAARIRGRAKSRWPIAYYPVVIGYWAAFEGGLNTWWVCAGLAAALALPFAYLKGRALTAIRGVEFAFFAYVIVRGTQLVLLWPW